MLILTVGLLLTFAFKLFKTALPNLSPGTIYVLPTNVSTAASFLYSIQRRIYPTGIYLLIVNNINTKARCGICSKLTVKGIVFIVRTCNCHI